MRYTDVALLASCFALLGFDTCTGDDDTTTPGTTPAPGVTSTPTPAEMDTPPVTPSPPPSSPTPVPPSDAIHDIQQGMVPTGTRVHLAHVVVTAPPTPWGDMFVQELEGGPWSGVFVSIADPDDLALAIGDLVTLDGTYNESYGTSTIFVDSGGDVTLVGTVEPPEPILVAPDAIATGGASAESYEGVLVRVTNVDCVDPNPDSPEDYGEFTVTGGLRVDDMYFDFYERFMPEAGDPIDEIAGVLHYTWSNFKLEPRSAFDIDPPRDLPADPSGPDLFVVTFIDVWQGDSALLELPGGYAVLIDGGDDGHGNWDVLQVMEKRGITSLDLMVMTHPHADHVGGLDEVIEQVDVAEVWENGETLTTNAYEDFVTAREARGVPVSYPEQGDETWLGDVHLEVLNSNEGYPGQNNDSLVIMFTYGAVRLLTTGDVEDEEQHDLVNDYGDALHADVIKVPHHGSPNYDTEFIATVSPDYAVISVGEGNDYNHPSQGNIDAYQAAGATVCRTDTSGDIMAVLDGMQVEFFCRNPE